MYHFYLQVPQLASSISEIQNRVLEEVQNLNFVKDNSATFIERKLSFEKKKPVQTLVSLVAFSNNDDYHLLSLFKSQYVIFHITYFILVSYNYLLHIEFLIYFYPLHYDLHKVIGFYLFCTRCIQNKCLSVLDAGRHLINIWQVKEQNFVEQNHYSLNLTFFQIRNPILQR